MAISFTFSRFDAHYLKFYNNIELIILKISYVFLFFKFLAGKWRHKVSAKIIFKYYGTVSERTCYEDPETEKNIWNMLIQSKVMVYLFSAILLLFLVTKWRKMQTSTHHNPYNPYVFNRWTHNTQVSKPRICESSFTSLRCKMRVLDSFGTDAEFNYQYYKENIPGGRSIWADLNLLLPQFMTMYRK